MDHRDFIERYHRQGQRALNPDPMNWGRDSAGAPARPGGVVEFQLPDGRTLEYATFTCRHCGLPQWIKPPLTLQDVAKCICCWGLVCHNCEPKGDCREAGEFMKQVEMAERRHRLRVAAGCVD